MRCLWVLGHHLVGFLILQIWAEAFWGRWPRHPRVLHGSSWVYLIQFTLGGYETSSEELQGLNLTWCRKAPTSKSLPLQLPESFRIEFEVVSDQTPHLDVLSKVNFFFKIAEIFKSLTFGVREAGVWVLTFCNWKEEELG